MSRSSIPKSYRVMQRGYSYVQFSATQIIFTTKLSTFLAGAATTTALGAHAQTATGSAEGFASGVTGGGDATVEPADIDELTSLLTGSEPQVIVLKQTSDYLESEGTATGTDCLNVGTDDACQIQIDTGSGCGDKDSTSITYYTAPKTPIDVASNKTIIGVGSVGVIRGKGLRFPDGASNIIVQNVAITDLNPKYVWVSFITGQTRNRNNPSLKRHRPGPERVRTFYKWLCSITVKYKGRVVNTKTQ
ncbi:hypothetical protein SLS58_005496 [Diplodia intermedia]|uniref:Pectin lyase n=1 Tax=Diplodia intermedia TaxID=856260 RepID=A0ABR3TQU5_9PEZI